MTTRAFYEALALHHGLQANSYDAKLLAQSISGIGDRQQAMRERLNHLDLAEEARRLAQDAVEA